MFAISLESKFTRAICGESPEGANYPCILPESGTEAASIAENNAISKGASLNEPFIFSWKNSTEPLKEKPPPTFSWSKEFAENSDPPNQKQWLENEGSWLEKQYGEKNLPPDIKIINRGYNVVPLFYCKTCGSADCCNAETGCSTCEKCPSEGCVMKKNKSFMF